MRNFTILTFMTLFISCSGERPLNLGVQKDRLLKPCPETPNCKQSQRVDDKEHFLKPIKMLADKEKALQKIIGIIKKNGNAIIVEMNDNYIYAQYTSSIFQFVDDVEFYFGDPEVIHFRSASRIGRKDFGVNQKRIEEIKFKYHQNDY